MLWEVRGIMAIFLSKNNSKDFDVKVIKELQSIKENETAKIAVKIVKINKYTYVDIRKMFRQNSDDTWKPTQKGIMLDFESFQLLIADSDKITEYLDK